MHGYWARRNRELSELHFKHADKVEAEIAKEYERAKNSIQKDIEVFYARYAKENDINMAETKKLLSPKELKGFKMSLEEFRDKAIHNENGQWTRDLDNEYIKSRVSRLEALKYQVRGETEALFDAQHDKFDKSLSKAFKDSYYSLSDELKGFARGRVDFATCDAEAVHNAIYTKWLDGNNFSSRIWNDKDRLLRELDTNLTQSIIRGDSPDRAIANISKRMDVSKSRSAALYQTEYAHIINQAHMQSIKDAGFEEYEIDESMDELTCDECQELHGQHFKLSEYEEGVTAPPFHTRCRGTVTAYFSEEMLADHSEELDNLLNELEGKSVDNSGESGIIKLGSGSGIMKPDEIIHKSLGAAGKNYPVKLPNGNHAKFAEGTKITNIKVFAGKDTDEPIRDAIFLEAEFGIKAEKWQKVRGEGFIVNEGKPCRAEVHWYEAEGQREKMKVKRWIDNET